jgi:branched-chain amino acid transport system ATP-binding protein
VTVPVLELDHVDAAYGPFRALFDVSLRVDPGEAVALVGANGAGKSTIARVASGLLPPTSGSVLVDGADLSGQAPFRYARAGIAHAPEGRSTFASLTVTENLELAFRSARPKRDVAADLTEAFTLFPKLGERREQLAGTLSGGEQRMLALARVLVLRPRLLVADELSLGLAPIVTADVYRVLGRVRDAGTALLVVEQHLDHALALADRVVVLQQGEVTFDGPPEQLGDLSTTVLLPAGSPSRADPTDAAATDAAATDGGAT